MCIYPDCDKRVDSQLMASLVWHTDLYVYPTFCMYVMFVPFFLKNSTVLVHVHTQVFLLCSPRALLRVWPMGGPSSLFRGCKLHLVKLVQLLLQRHHMLQPYKPKVRRREGACANFLHVHIHVHVSSNCTCTFVSTEFRVTGNRHLCPSL